MEVGKALSGVERDVLAALESLSGGSVFQRTAPAAGRTVKIGFIDGNLERTVVEAAKSLKASTDEELMK